MSYSSEDETDPLKLHKVGTSLSDSGKYEAAIQKFEKASILYKKVQNFFDASYTLFKAAECSFLLKDYDAAIKRFIESSEIAFDKGYDRFGLGALEYALDCYKAKGKEGDNETVELKKKITEVKKRIEASAF